MRSILLVILLMLTLPAIGASHYVRQGAGNKGVVVFVHGVTGDAVSTWTNAKTGADWPRLMAGDPAFAAEDVFVYEYPSPKLGSSYNINELAEDMRLSLAGPMAAHDRVIFLAHSMGGLVVRQYLLKYREIAEKVAFTYFYATPTTGSPMAALASIISRNPQIGNLKPMNVDEYLGNLQRDWLASSSLRTIPAYCAYETRPLLVSRVVEQESATNLCNQYLDPIDANHIDIVKPESMQDKRYRTFAAAYAATQGSMSRDGLRVEVQNARQLIGLNGEAPRTTRSETVFCDSMKLTLVLANPTKAKSPVLINSISVESAPMDADQIAQMSPCKVDRFSSRPHGIVERNTYMLQVDDSAVRGKYLKDASNSVPITPANVLAIGSAAKAIALRPGEEPFGLDFYLQSGSKEPRQVTFIVSFDQDGEKKLATHRVVLWK